MRLLIRGGDVLDGTGAPSTRSDVLISDGRIEEIAPNISAPDALAIDAVGCVVTPGFVDMHRHCDIAAVTGGAFGKLELAQGITSTIAGNCGLAPVPCAPSHRRELYDFLEPITGAIAPDLLFQDYSSYLNALKAASLPLNVGFLAGLGAIRTAILGFTKNPLSADGLKTAEAFVRQAMEHGAFGISTGLMYQPECYALRDEMVAQAKVAAKYDGILCAHIRGEGDHLVESVREAIGIAMKSGIRLNISHFKGTGVRNWGKAVYRAMEELEAARALGHEVTADFYP
jgi:N-acyl-D-amino-acid deacylase